MPGSFDMPITSEAKEAFASASTLAAKCKCDMVRTEHLLLALMKMPDSHAGVLLTEMAASPSALETIVSTLPGHGDQKLKDDLSPDDIAFLQGI